MQGGQLVFFVLRYECTQQLTKEVFPFQMVHIVFDSRVEQLVGEDKDVRG